MSAPSAAPRQDELSAAALSRFPTNVAVVLPTVNLPVLSPGYPLASNTAAIEASISCYFRPGHHPYGKRGRSVTGAGVTTPTSPTVLDILYLEEDAHSGGSGGAQQQRATSPTSSNNKNSTAASARTRAYLTKLFREPARCEQDVFRLVDVAHCRRALRDEEEAIRKGGNGSPSTTDDVAAVNKVSAFNSCLTMGQHRRYRTMVLEWLRHQPVRAAPPDSGEVLKVVQQEQRLFLEVLRSEAVARLPNTGVSSLYTLLTPTLLRYAKSRRISRMQRQLLRFLDDAKAHDGTVLLCCCPPTSSGPEDGINAAEAEADYSGVIFEHDDASAGGADAFPSSPVHTLAPKQLYQRRYPSLRVLQWHMAKLYNAHQTGIAAPFPNPQIESTVKQRAATAVEVVSPTKTVSPAESPREGAVREMPRDAPPRLMLCNLPVPDSTPDGEENSCNGRGSSHRSDNASKDEKGAEEQEREERAPLDFTFADLDGPLGETATMSAAVLRAYVEQRLLPRFGWRCAKSNGDGGGGTAPPPPDHDKDPIESISLSITFAGLLKLFVAHVDTEEPRTSFRVPVRTRLTTISPLRRRGKGNQQGDTAAASPRYHAAVTVGDAVPNVKESRHGVQVAAAECLLRQHYSDTCSHGNMADTVSKGMVGERVGRDDAARGSAATASSPPLVAHVQLTRSATMQNTVVQGEAAVQAAGGDRIKASAAVLLSMKEAVADAAPVLVFQVSPPDNMVPLTRTAASDLSLGPCFVLAKMEHLNATSAGCSVVTPAAAPVHLENNEAATQCPYLLELLSPREMLQLDLIFACYPDAAVRLHRVQLTGHENATAATDTVDKGMGNEGAEGEECMQVLTVETLTRVSWAHLRQQLQSRPLESLITSPAPAEVLATQSWDLLYDTLAWLLDSIVRRASDAVRARQPSSEVAPSFTAGEENDDRFIYFILSNHANLVNTSESAKLYAKKPRHRDAVPENVASTFTESRFAVRYVLQDASELYPNYEPRADVTFEAENLAFLESMDQDSGGDGAQEEGRGVNSAASRLYRDPQAWNADTIPFTFHRRASHPPFPSPSPPS
jgi:hypothetical protein